MRTRIVFLLLVSPLLLSVVALHAQTTGPVSTTYVVGPFSSVQEGCFEPCMCPISLLFLGGTFELTSTGTDGAFETFAISDIDWTATVGGHLLEQITGSGSYRRTVDHQQLILDLQIDAGAVEHYDSGLVPVAVDFPGIEAVASIGKLFCYDKAMVVTAAPLATGGIDLAVSTTDLGWTMAPGADAYDVVSGDLGSLASTGDFAMATLQCLADDHAATTLPNTDTVAPGEAIWYLVRGLPQASYDTGTPSQQGDRTRIDQAYGSCPAQPIPCVSNIDCAAGNYCEKSEGDCPGEGVCAPLAEACIQVIIPVCGCDGVTYNNACEAAMAGANVAYSEVCS